jgi:hypothetical protein
MEAGRIMLFLLVYHSFPYSTVPVTSASILLFPPRQDILKEHRSPLSPLPFSPPHSLDIPENPQSWGKSSNCHLNTLALVPLLISPQYTHTVISQTRTALSSPNWHSQDSSRHGHHSSTHSQRSFDVVVHSSPSHTNNSPLSSTALLLSNSANSPDPFSTHFQLLGKGQ